MCSRACVCVEGGGSPLPVHEQTVLSHGRKRAPDARTARENVMNPSRSLTSASGSFVPGLNLDRGQGKGMHMVEEAWGSLDTWSMQKEQVAGAKGP